MATYYRWRRRNVTYSNSETEEIEFEVEYWDGTGTAPKFYFSEEYETIDDHFLLSNPVSYVSVKPKYNTDISAGYAIYESSASSTIYHLPNGGVTFRAGNMVYIGRKTTSGTIKKITRSMSIGSSSTYVYSTSSSAYPNGGVSGSYYYDQRTTVTSPTAPSSIGFQAPSISTPTTTVQWGAATSNTDYPVNLYEVSVSGNGSSYSVVGTTSSTSMLVQVPTGTTMMYVRVRARDTNNQWGTYATSQAPVYLSPVLTVPQMVMQGQSATVSWTAIDGADSYTLQRKANTDADWTQVYSGANLSYSETVGTWTSLQYRVQAVFDETPGGWATSDPIQIVSASALVISGQDGDLGKLVNDVPYSISSDQTSPTIDVTVEVNGGEYASFQATSGQTYKVGVLDLPTGTGSIVITASTTVSESPVTVTRTWTYSKTAQTFPNAGGVAQLTKEGAVIWPKTLDEAVRAAMTPWGGNLSTALNLLKNAALFNRTKQPKYSEVTVSMANVTEGQIVNIPRGGVMVPHYVGKLEYESGLNGAGRRLLVPVECYDQRTWNSNAVNTYANSDIDTWMNGDYKALFPEEIQTAMGATKFYYTPGNNNWTVGILERSIFALSGTELGETYLYVNEEGSTLPISPTLKVAHKNGEKIEQWTRSPYKNVTSSVEILGLTGKAEVKNCSEDYCGSRPCFTLPSTFTYGPVYVGQNGGIHDAQEYTEAGDWLDVWGNAIPAVKIATGSYVGTGTSGQNNPTTLTFPFEPKIVFIARGTTPYGGLLGTITPMIRGVQKSIVGINGSSLSIAYLTWDNNSLSFYGNGGADTSLNESGITYHYVAIG